MGSTTQSVELVGQHSSKSRSLAEGSGVEKTMWNGNLDVRQGIIWPHLLATMGAQRSGMSDENTIDENSMDDESGRDRIDERSVYASAESCG
mmetsp:Transcript_73379/g.110705  ORF Transcript_73379/g.110705 Transcript_73379/m.110705 type:complete len:92 (-) Transcript_73379:689-964(-)